MKEHFERNWHHYAIIAFSFGVAFFTKLNLTQCGCLGVIAGLAISGIRQKR